jgi:hypothetical protein
MDKSNDWDGRIKSYPYVGRHEMTENGLQLRSVVAEDFQDRFHAGTRYGPIGAALPELGSEDFYITTAFKTKGEAIFAARQDTTETLRRINGHAKAEAILKAASIPNKVTKAPRPHLRLIDR